MTPEQKRDARKLVQLKGFPKPGTLFKIERGNRRCADGMKWVWVEDRYVPDLSDAATLGVLFRVIEMHPRYYRAETSLHSGTAIHYHSPPPTRAFFHTQEPTRWEAIVATLMVFYS